MVLTVDVARDRSGDRHVLGAGEHRHDPALRHELRQQLAERDPGLGGDGAVGEIEHETLQPSGLEPRARRPAAPRRRSCGPSRGRSRPEPPPEAIVARSSSIVPGRARRTEAGSAPPQPWTLVEIGTGRLGSEHRSLDRVSLRHAHPARTTRARRGPRAGAGGLAARAPRAPRPHRPGRAPRSAAGTRRTARP